MRVLVCLMIAGAAFGQRIDDSPTRFLPSLGPKPPSSVENSYAPLPVNASPTTPFTITPAKEVTSSVIVGSNDVPTAKRKIAQPIPAAPAQPVTVWEKVQTPPLTLAPAPNPWQTAPDKSAWESKPATGAWK